MYKRVNSVNRQQERGSSVRLCNKGLRVGPGKPINEGKRSNLYHVHPGANSRESRWAKVVIKE